MKKIFSMLVAAFFLLLTNETQATVYLNLSEAAPYSSSRSYTNPYGGYSSYGYESQPSSYASGQSASYQRPSLNLQEATSGEVEGPLQFSSGRAATSQSSFYGPSSQPTTLEQQASTPAEPQASSERFFEPTSSAAASG